jgi:hypothetical protein
MGEETRNTWGGRREGSGRPRGSTDRRPREIREMLLEACARSNYGKDPAHPNEPGSALQFFITLANNNLDIFAQLLLKTIPKQVNTQTESTIGIEIYRSELEIRRDMEAQGFSPKQIEMIKNILPGPTPISGKEQLLDEELHDGEDILFDRKIDHD